MIGIALHTVGAGKRPQFGFVHNVLIYILAENSCSPVVQLYHFLIA